MPRRQLHLLSSTSWKTTMMHSHKLYCDVLTEIVYLDQYYFVLTQD